MTPTEFPGCNIVFGAKQPEYQPLPALKLPNGTVITCWELSEEEKKVVAENGKIYLTQLTFNQALQPILPQVDLDNLNLDYE